MDKKVVLIVIVVILIAIGVSFYRSNKTATESATNVPPPPRGEVSTIKEGTPEETYQIDTQASTAGWTGSKKLVVNYYDSGSIAIKRGEATIVNNALTGGHIVFDMTTINATSTGKGDGQDGLSIHLKSPDFFDVTKYPESKFTITTVQTDAQGKTTLNGTLSIKDVTCPISIPVTVAAQNEGIQIKGVAAIDRSLWNVKYGSESFFDNLGDKVIDDMFTLGFTVLLKK